MPGDLPTPIVINTSGVDATPQISVDKHGTQTWRLNGMLHRTDGPARIRPSGSQEWWENDLLHRTDGPARIHANGSQEWYENDQLHRTDGPARIHANGHQEWWVHSLLHRTDGPARIWSDGHQEWWVRGKEITNHVNNWNTTKGVTWPWDQSTQAEFVLTWC